MVIDIEDYIQRRINFMVAKNKIFINYIREELFKVRKFIRNIFYQIIPEDFFDPLNSAEFELILNGRPFIDIEDWKHNTIYQGKYSVKHKTIKWFWKILNNLTQEELSKFLQFSTGTQRVPIGGFESLESNRGEIARFCIVSVPFVMKKQNFIRAHTCFNRIDLPIYNTEEQLKESIIFLLKNETGFGIDQVI